MNQNPFSLYDFLGYLAPGAIFNLELLFIFQKCSVNLIDFSDKTSIYQWLILIIFVLSSYVFGFALSIVSGELVEKYLLWRSGYPSKVRFGVPQKTFIECLFDDKYRNLVYMIFFVIFLFPVLIFDFIFGKLLGIEEKYFKHYRNPNELIIVKEQIYQILRKLTDDPENFVNSNSNFFKYIYHYTYENRSQHSKKMQNYVALYGFSRTMTLITSLFFVINVFSIAINKFGMTFININTIINSNLFIISSGLLSYIFFVGFAKYYRRYTDEVLMAAVAMSISTEPNPDTEEPNSQE